MTTEQEPGPTQAADVYQQMSMMVTSHWIPQVVRAAVDLSLPDHLAEGGLTADEVAQREDSASGTTFRLMRACVVLGLLTVDTEGRFHGTSLLATLGTDFFDYLAKHPSQARDFSEGLTSTTSLWTSDAAKVIDTTGVKLVVDLGVRPARCCICCWKAIPVSVGLCSTDRTSLMELRRRPPERASRIALMWSAATSSSPSRRQTCMS